MGLFFFFLLKNVTSLNYDADHGASTSYLSGPPVALTLQAEEEGGAPGSWFWQH